jgi:hypothetical protein
MYRYGFGVDVVPVNIDAKKVLRLSRQEVRLLNRIREIELELKSKEEFLKKPTGFLTSKKNKQRLEETKNNTRKLTKFLKKELTRLRNELEKVNSELESDLGSPANQTEWQLEELEKMIEKAEMKEIMSETPEEIKKKNTQKFIMRNLKERAKADNIPPPTFRNILEIHNNKPVTGVNSKHSDKYKGYYNSIIGVGWKDFLDSIDKTWESFFGKRRRSKKRKSKRRSKKRRSKRRSKKRKSKRRSKKRKSVK